MRCFVALDLPAAVRAAVIDAQEALRRAAPRADVRWVGAAGLHVTLKFLGEVAEARRDEVVAALGRAAAAHSPLGLVVRGLGGFPSARRPRVVWAGLAGGTTKLAALARDVDAALAALGFPAEARPFRSHVTLGRVRSARGLGTLAAALERQAGVDLGAWIAADITLYRSRLGPGGATYEALARLSLGGAEPAR
ncbi:MAG TPA: RNA 2',3'-cyclic phosphodiesterase [Candidatus Binatia bacterium]|nr:RNA 2',3'-cyclic phosphodiesterase [Candidatus Binatia bacterium]